MTFLPTNEMHHWFNLREESVKLTDVSTPSKVAEGVSELTHETKLESNLWHECNFPNIFFLRIHPGSPGILFLWLF